MGFLDKVESRVKNSAKKAGKAVGQIYRGGSTLSGIRGTRSTAKELNRRNPNRR